MAVSNFGVVWENKRQSASALAANSNFNKSVNNLNVGHWTDAMSRPLPNTVQCPIAITFADNTF